MLLTYEEIFLFRSLAVMIAFTDLLNSKKRSRLGVTSTNNSNIGNDRINITWNDIILIHSEIIENKRITLFHKAEKVYMDDNDDTEVATTHGSEDDTASINGASVNGSIRSKLSNNTNVTSSKLFCRYRYTVTKSINGNSRSIIE